MIGKCHRKLTLGRIYAVADFYQIWIDILGPGPSGIPKSMGMSRPYNGEFLCHITSYNLKWPLTKPSGSFFLALGTQNVLYPDGSGDWGHFWPTFTGGIQCRTKQQTLRCLWKRWISCEKLKPRLGTRQVIEADFPRRCLDVGALKACSPRPKVGKYD